MILGLGNWLLSQNKVLEYTHRVESRNAIQNIAPLTDFPSLTPRINAALLEGLHRSPRDYTLAHAKLDFYRVVQRGGQLLCVIGLLCIGAAFLRRGQRSEPTVAANGSPGR